MQNIGRKQNYAHNTPTVPYIFPPFLHGHLVDLLDNILKHNDNFPETAPRRESLP